MIIPTCLIFVCSFLIVLEKSLGCLSLRCVKVSVDKARFALLLIVNMEIKQQKSTSISIITILSIQKATKCSKSFERADFGKLIGTLIYIYFCEPPIFLEESRDCFSLCCVKAPKGRVWLIEHRHWRQFKWL